MMSTTSDTNGAKERRGELSKGYQRFLEHSPGAIYGIGCLMMVLAGFIIGIVFSVNCSSGSPELHALGDFCGMYEAIGAAIVMVVLAIVFISMSVQSHDKRQGTPRATP